MVAGNAPALSWQTAAHSWARGSVAVQNLMDMYQCLMTDSDTLTFSHHESF